MNRNIRSVISLLGIVACLALVPAHATAGAGNINYQGYLTDAAGLPVSGPMNLTVSIYDAPAAGNLLWSDTVAATVTAGLFSIELGSVLSPLDPAIFNQNLWLGIGVGADPEMTPRKPLSSASSAFYAFNAGDAATLGGRLPADLDQSAHVVDTNNPHAVTAAQVNADAYGSAAAVQANLDTHKASQANPHAVTAAQVGAVSTAAGAAHMADPAAHHARYTNAEAVAAVGPHTPPITTVDGLTGGAITGAVSATSFAGDGSALTGITAGQVGADAYGSAGGVQANLDTHAVNPSAHHVPYSDADAIAIISSQYPIEGGGKVGANTAYGWSALGNFFAGNGIWNTAIGNAALLSLIVASDRNTALGERALQNLQFGSGNTAVGYNAGSGIISDSYGNVFLGNEAGALEWGSNKLYIANNQTTPLIYGDFALGTVDVYGSLSATSFTGDGSALTGITAAQVGAADQAVLNAHIANSANPHAVTAAQVGADAYGSAAAVQGVIDAHLADIANPHAVTAVQVNADAYGSAAAVQTNLDAHAANQTNPHNVTAAQIGAAGTALANTFTSGQIIQSSGPLDTPLTINGDLSQVTPLQVWSAYGLTASVDSAANIATDGNITALGSLTAGSISTNDLTASLVTTSGISNDGISKRIALDPAGNVGIGTPSPFAKLDVAGMVKAVGFTGDGTGLTNVTPGSHVHDGADITTGIVADARIDPLIARDTEIMPTVLAGDGTGSGVDADLLDGLDSTAFASSTHNHDASYVLKAGDTITGNLAVNASVVGAGTAALTVDATPTTGSNFGIMSTNHSNAGTGIFGNASSVSGYTYGIRGQSSSSLGTGVSGSALSTTGNNFGVRGQSYSTTGTGVSGVAQAVSGVNYGVYGQSASPSGYGVYSQGNAHVQGNLSVSGSVTGDGSGLTNVAGSVPAGFMIVGNSDVPPPGYTYTGMQVTSSSGNVWTAKVPMLTARHSLAVAATGGKIYAIGGWDGVAYLAVNEEYDPVADIWTTKAPMPTARYGMAASAVGGKVYVIGGTNGAYLSTNEEYDPAADAWTTKAPMLTARFYLAASDVAGKVYALGGANGTVLATNEEYDPVADIWTAKTPMPTARYGMTVSAIAGMAYAIGGWNGAVYLATNEEYDPVANLWTTKTPMPTARTDLTSAVVYGMVYAIGGTNGAYLSTNDAYDPVVNLWTAKAPMPTARSHLASTVVGSKVYAIGGMTAGGAIIAQDEEYDTSIPLYLHAKN